MCYATDLKKVMPLVEKCHDLNGHPANVIPLELAWGESDHYSALAQRLEDKPIDFIICSDLVYDEEAFDILINTLVELSKINQHED